MRPMLFLVLTFTIFSASAQKENIPATENFSIEGKVKKDLMFHWLIFHLTNRILSTVLLLLIILAKKGAL